MSSSAFANAIQGQDTSNDNSRIEEVLNGDEDTEEEMGGQRLFCEDDNEDEDCQSDNQSVQSLGRMNDAVPENTNFLVERNLFLSRHLFYVEERLNARIADLKAKVVELEAKQTLSCHLCSCDSITPSTEERKTEAMTSKIIESSTTRKHRVDTENAHISQVLSDLIYNFVTHSPLTANKKRFKRSRLARIIVDSVILFPWTHTRIQESASTINKNMLAPTALVALTADSADLTSQNNRLLQSLSTLLNKNLRCHGNNSKASILVDCIWNADTSFLEGEAKSCMVERVRRHMRYNVFTTSKILKAMDLAGFNLSLAGIETLRSVETDNKKYYRGFLPSKSSILRAARKVEQNADDLCPFKMIGRSFETAECSNECGTASDFGEGFEFDVLKTVRTLFDAFGLTDDAKN